MAKRYTFDAEFEACVNTSHIRDLFGSVPLPLGDVEARRQHLKQLSLRRTKSTALPDDVEWSDHYTPSDDGTGHRVLVRWYQYKKQKRNQNDLSAAVIYLHGGGLISNSINDYDAMVASLVSDTLTPFLAVEYRLAPEHCYPIALNDSYAALKWIHHNAHSLNVDRRRIAIMGSSAGGGLGAATTILAHSRRETDRLMVAKQIYIAPMLDYRTTCPNTESDFDGAASYEHRARGESPVQSETSPETTSCPIAPFLFWNYADNATGWSSYLGKCGLSGRSPSKIPPETASPALLTSARYMPPLYIEVGELDIFAKEDIEFALKHVVASVPVELHVHRGLPHAYDAFAPQCQLVRAARNNRLNAIRSIHAV